MSSLVSQYTKHVAMRVEGAVTASGTVVHTNRIMSVNKIMSIHSYTTDRQNDREFA